MVMPGKEGAPVGVDQLAVREVEGYIDRIEKQVETPTTGKQSSQTTVVPSDRGVTVSTPVIPALPVEQKPKVILPLQKEEIERGLRGKVSEGVTWLSRWCLYMIKKYPGRIFYSPVKQNV